MENIYYILNKPKNKELKKIYETSSTEIKEMMDKIYGCCFRFNLLSIQAEHMLKEALSPFFKDKLINIILEE